MAQPYALIREPEAKPGDDVPETEKANLRRGLVHPRDLTEADHRAAGSSPSLRVFQVPSKAYSATRAIFSSDSQATTSSWS